MFLLLLLDLCCSYSLPCSFSALLAPDSAFAHAAVFALTHSYVPHSAHDLFYHLILPPSLAPVSTSVISLSASSLTAGHAFASTFIHALVLALLLLLCLFLNPHFHFLVLSPRSCSYSASCSCSCFAAILFILYITISPTVDHM